MSFPVEFSNRPSNTITSLPDRVSQSGFDASHLDDALNGFSIRLRRTLMQRSRDTHPHFLNAESVLQNMPGGNPMASQWVTWEHTNTIIPNPNISQSYDRYAYVLNNPLKYIDPNGYATCEEMPWECDSNGNWLDDDNILFSPTPPPDELLQPGYEWWLVTEDGILTYYYIPSINSSEAGLSSNPNDWIGDLYKEAKREGSVIINGELWKYDNERFVKQSFCSNGDVPVGYGCLNKPVVTSVTEDGRPIYSVDGAVAACPPGGGGTNACGTSGFNPAFQQGGPPLYVNVPGDSRSGYVLVVNPIDSGGRLGETQIDIYAGINRSWPYLLNNPYTVWRQGPSNYISSHGAQ